MKNLLFRGNGEGWRFLGMKRTETLQIFTVLGQMNVFAYRLGNFMAAQHFIDNRLRYHSVIHGIHLISQCARGQEQAGCPMVACLHVIQFAIGRDSPATLATELSVFVETDPDLRR